MMIDWYAILFAIILTPIMVFVGWVLCEYPFIRNKEKSIFKTFINWYKNLK